MTILGLERLEKEVFLSSYATAKISPKTITGSYYTLHLLILILRSRDRRITHVASVRPWRLEQFSRCREVLGTPSSLSGLSVWWWLPQPSLCSGWRC